MPIFSITMRSENTAVRSRLPSIHSRLFILIMIDTMNFSAGRHTKKIPTSGGVPTANVPRVKLSTMGVLMPFFFYFRTDLVDISDFACPTCKFKSCFNCRTPAHPQVTCMENWTNARNQFFAADEPSGIWLKSYTKPCYCGRWIQKMDGCDHVKCPARPIGCGGEWCWMCGAKYDEIRRVGNIAHKSDCPHYV